jgi:hypothetical protein
MGFSKPVTLTLGQRSAYLCNNPDCRKLTIGPHSEASKSLVTGEAAHVCAESEGGPRYDSGQSEVERNSILNGIWLCTECHTKIDKDTGLYTRETLLNWKQKHEAYISGQGWKPDLPEITISTRRGLTANPTGETKFTAEDFAMFRDHDLFIRNTNSIPIHGFKARMQFPEGIVGFMYLELPNGGQVSFRAEELGGWTVGSKSGKGEVEMSIPQRQWFSDFLFDVDKLNPTFSVSILMRSIQTQQQDQSWKAMMIKDNVIENYFHGSFQYEWRGVYYNRTLVVPILYDKQTRTITTPAIHENPEDAGLRLVTRHKLV